MFKNRLKEILLYCVESKGADNFESLIDVILMEQFVNSIPKNVRDFVLARSPDTADKCSELADLCNVISRSVDDDMNIVRNGASNAAAQSQLAPVAKGNAFRKHGTGNGANNGTGIRPAVANRVTTFGNRQNSGCFYCHDLNHKYANCPQRQLAKFKALVMYNTADILAMCCKVISSFCDICCFRSASGGGRP